MKKNPNLDDLTIYIPTRGRLKSQITHNGFPTALRKKIQFVVDYNDPDKEALLELYPDVSRDIFELPKKDSASYSRFSQAMLEACPTKYVVLLNDDIRFNKRRENMKISTSTNKEVVDGFKQMIRWMDEGLIHCGMAPRDASYASTVPYSDNARVMHALFYNSRAVIDAGCAFTKNVTKNFQMADFHMNLQLLEKGYPNKVSYVYRINPKPTNVSGGSSLHRTKEQQDYSAEALRKNHPLHVKIVTKKNVWEGWEEQRKDVIVQWKIAYAWGVANAKER